MLTVVLDGVRGAGLSTQQGMNYCTVNSHPEGFMTIIKPLCLLFKWLKYLSTMYIHLVNTIYPGHTHGLIENIWGYNFYFHLKQNPCSNMGISTICCYLFSITASTVCSKIMQDLRLWLRALIFHWAWSGPAFFIPCHPLLRFSNSNGNKDLSLPLGFKDSKLFQVFQHSKLKGQIFFFFLILIGG